MSLSLVTQNLQNILHTAPIKLQLLMMEQDPTSNGIMEYTSEILIDSLLHTLNTKEWFEKSSKKLPESIEYTYRFIFNNVYNKLRVTFDFFPVKGISTLKEPCMYFKSNLYFNWMGKEKERRNDLMTLFLTTTLAKVFLNTETDRCIVDYYVPVKDTESIIDIPATYLRWVECKSLQDSTVVKDKYEYVFPGVRMLINKVIEYQDETSKGKITKLLQTIIGEGLDE